MTSSDGLSPSSWGVGTYVIYNELLQCDALLQAPSCTSKYVFDNPWNCYLECRGNIIKTLQGQYSVGAWLVIDHVTSRTFSAYI